MQWRIIHKYATHNHGNWKEKAIIVQSFMSDWLRKFGIPWNLGQQKWSRSKNTRKTLHDIMKNEINDGVKFGLNLSRKSMFTVSTELRKWRTAFTRRETDTDKTGRWRISRHWNQIVCLSTRSPWGFNSTEKKIIMQLRWRLPNPTDNISVIIRC